MQTQTITLELPTDTLRRVERLADDRHTSISALLLEILEGLLSRQDVYEKAKRRHLAVLEKGFDLGTGGSLPWSRDELHER